ncbi:hypothetical protein FISHEDRAFT_11585, partial [Fistulina hepatica ATCC 64428]
PTVSEFVGSVSYPLTIALVGLSPYINRIRALVEIASWKGSWYDSWLIVAAWWTICLFSAACIRYFLPFAVLVSLVATPWTNRPQSTSEPITETHLQTIIADVTAIYSLMPSVALPVHSPSTYLRIVAFLYPPYLALTRLVPIEVFLGICGSFVLIARAPWFILLQQIVWKSAWIRWLCYHLWSRLSGYPLEMHVLPPEPLRTTADPSSSRRFMFTVYENQRWWMGLDWQPALLPAERPSWCAASLEPQSPPSMFQLPTRATVQLPDGVGKTIKRTAIWHWEEPEWQVVVRLSEADQWSRVHKPLPVPSEENPGLLARAAGRMKESSTLSGLGSSGSHGDIPEHTDGEESESSSAETITDADGWVYYDNKWENPSNKGGLGKYTRCRKWTRVAIVDEVVE